MAAAPMRAIDFLQCTATLWINSQVAPPATPMIEDDPSAPKGTKRSRSSSDIVSSNAEYRQHITFTNRL